jgi:ABC-type multidrug transport system fused ATPase/permease subunit
MALSKAFAAAQGIISMIDRQDPRSATPNLGEDLKLESVKGHLKLHDVSFSYPARPNIRIFDHLTCEFPAGKTTAVIGVSGAGKSMLCTSNPTKFSIKESD